MAETRTIRTVLELNAQRFTTGAAQASASAKSLAGELRTIRGEMDQTQLKLASPEEAREIRRQAAEAQKAYNTVSNTLLGVGTAAVTGMGLATKASMDWESAWAGVLKTVDGSPEQLGRVEEGLRGLTKELPASHTEIAAVAEAAGQLGVQTDSVVEFTRTMINLGETTNLASEEAATSLARFSNIMGTSQDDVDRLGAALVGLGNSYATTESEILRMSMRLAGTGNQLSLSEGEVMGLATAMSSVGIEAEAGGTAMSMGMRKINDAVAEGGESLAGFAEVAGMSASEFERLWAEDAAAGLDAFVQGLGRIGDEGGNVSAVLGDLGIKGIRESDTFLRLAGSADILGEALAMGNTEFERNLALTEEAAKRYETTESQLQLAKNAIVDAGIDIGGSFLPLLADAAGHVASLAEAFTRLPDPIQDSVVQFGAIAGATALVGGAAMRAVPSLIDTWSAFKNLRDTSPKTASAITKVGKAVGVATVAFTAATALASYGDSLNDVTITAEEAAAAAMKLSDEADPLQTVFQGMGTSADVASSSTKELEADLDRIANGHWYEGISNLETNLRNVFGAGLDTTEDIRQRIEEIGNGIAAVAQNDLPQAQAGFRALHEEFGGTDEAGQNLLSLMPSLRNELAGIANEAGLDATDQMVLLGLATGELVPAVNEATGEVEGYNVAQEDMEGATDEATAAVEEQVDALAELQDLLEDTANLLLGVRGSERDFLDSVDAATGALKEQGEVFTENGELIDRNSEAMRNAEADLDGVVASTHAWANSAEEAGASAEELDGIISEGRNKFVELAQEMGMSEEAANRLADEMQLIPEFVETEVRLQKEEAQAKWDEIYARLWPDGGHPPLVLPVDFEYDEDDPLFGPGTIVLDPATKPVEADTGPAEEGVNGFVEDVEGESATKSIAADDHPARQQLTELEQAINASGGTVEMNGATHQADSALEDLIEIIDNSDGTVWINGDAYPAEYALEVVRELVDNSEGEITIKGDNSPAKAATNDAKSHADGTTGTIDVEADTSDANSDINSAARGRSSLITASAATSSAEYQLNRLARNRTATVTVNTVSRGGGSGLGRIPRAAGGWLNEGLNAGGWVPGPYPGPGVDNVLWPVKSGLASGGMSVQPLAGTEFVVRGDRARQWGPALEAINSGVSRAEVAELIGAQPSRSGMALTQNLYGPDAGRVARESYALYRHEARRDTADL